MKRSLRTVFLSLVVLAVPAGIAMADGGPIAFYTLNQTAADLLGRNPDASIVNAPYEDGGVYLNGNYVGTDPDSSMVATPGVADLDFSAFSVKLEFKIGEIPTSFRPILFCGQSWRWMGATLNTNGQIFLNYNGYPGPTGAQVVTPGVWHTLAMTHDGTTGRLILDGVEQVSQDFVPVDGGDRRFVTHNGSNGTAFKGHIRNLAVYDGVVEFVAGVGDELSPHAALGLGNYPNPFNPSTTIKFALPTAATTSLKIYDVAGRFLRTLVHEERLGKGPHERVWDGADVHGRALPSGTYFFCLQTGGVIETNRMTLLR